MGKKLEEELGDLDDEECEQIMRVLQKDIILKCTDQERISQLKDNVLDGTMDLCKLEYEANSKRCFICSRRFFYFVRSAFQCSDCGYYVCGKCRKPRTSATSRQDTQCTICANKNLYKSQSLLWFYNRVNSKFKATASADVIRSLCRRSKKGSSAAGTVRSSGEENQSRNSGERQSDYITEKYFRSLEELHSSDEDSLDEAIRHMNARLSSEEEKYCITTQHLQQSTNSLRSLYKSLNELENQVVSIETEFPRPGTRSQSSDDETASNSPFSSATYDDLFKSRSNMAPSSAGPSNDRVVSTVTRLPYIVPLPDDAIVATATRLSKMALPSKRSKFIDYLEQINDSTTKIFSLESHVTRLERTILSLDQAALRNGTALHRQLSASSRLDLLTGDMIGGGDNGNLLTGDMIGGGDDDDLLTGDMIGGGDDDDLLTGNLIGGSDDGDLHYYSESGDLVDIELEVMRLAVEVDKSKKEVMKLHNEIAKY